MQPGGRSRTTAVPITVNDGPKDTSKTSGTKTDNNGTTKTKSKPVSAIL